MLVKKANQKLGTLMFIVVALPLSLVFCFYLKNKNYKPNEKNTQIVIDEKREEKSNSDFNEKQIIARARSIGADTPKKTIEEIRTQIKHLRTEELKDLLIKLNESGDTKDVYLLSFILEEGLTRNTDDFLELYKKLTDYNSRNTIQTVCTILLKNNKQTLINFMNNLNVDNAHDALLFNNAISVMAYYESDLAVDYVLKHNSSFLPEIFRTIAIDDVQKAVTLAQKIKDNKIQEIALRSSIESYARNDPKACYELVKTLPTDISQNLLLTVFNSWFEKNTASAQSEFEKIDQKVQQNLLKDNNLFDTFMSTMPTALIKVVDKLPLNAETFDLFVKTYVTRKDISLSEKIIKINAFDNLKLQDQVFRKVFSDINGANLNEGISAYFQIIDSTAKISALNGLAKPFSKMKEEDRILFLNKLDSSNEKNSFLGSVSIMLPLHDAWSYVNQITDPEIKKQAEGKVWAREKQMVNDEVKKSPEEAMTAIANGTSQHEAYWMEEAVNVWLAKDFEGANKWYEKNWKTLSKDKAQYAAAAFATQAIKAGELDTASQWLGYISDPKMKQRIQGDLENAGK